MRTLILSIFLYACESWTLTAETDRRIQAPEMRCYKRLLNISYKVHVTNEEVRNRIQNATGVHDNLLTMVKKRKLRWYGHISRSSGMAKTILQGTVKGARRRGRQKKRWEDNIEEWTGMGFGDSLRAAEDREGWKGIVATSSVVPQRPPRLRDWDELWWTIIVKKPALVSIVSEASLESTLQDFEPRGNKTKLTDKRFVTIFSPCTVAKGKVASMADYDACQQLIKHSSWKYLYWITVRLRSQFKHLILIISVLIDNVWVFLYTNMASMADGRPVTCRS